MSFAQVCRNEEQSGITRHRKKAEALIELSGGKAIIEIWKSEKKSKSLRALKVGASGREPSPGKVPRPFVASVLKFRRGNLPIYASASTRPGGLNAKSSRMHRKACSSKRFRNSRATGRQITIGASARRN